MAKAKIASSKDKGLLASELAHSKTIMPFTPAGAWKHVTETLNLKVPKDDVESFDSFWTASLNFAALEAYATSVVPAPDGNNSGVYNNMHLWIEMADAAQNATLPNFPSTEYASWRANDKLTALSARRFAIHALHSMSFKFLKPNLVNPFQIPDRTFLLQFQRHRELILLHAMATGSGLVKQLL